MTEVKGKSAEIYFNYSIHWQMPMYIADYYKQKSPILNFNLKWR